MSKTLQDSAKVELTPDQARYVAARLTHRSIVSAAAATEIPERTAREWEKASVVKQALLRLQSEVMEDAARLARVRILEALEYLAQVMGDDEHATRDRIGAARAILSTAPKVIDANDLLKRLRLLE